MKKLTALVLPFLFAACNVDVLGIFGTTDVDQRFNDSMQSPPPSAVSVTATNFSILVLSDEHVYYGSNENFVRLTNFIEADDRLMILCGDNVQNGRESDFLALKDYLTMTGLPYYLTPGNHDIYNGGWQYFNNVFGRDCYSVSTGKVRLICLDSASGTLGGLQRQWLENTFAAATEPVIVVFTHFEFFRNGITELQQYTDPEEVLYLMNLFETHGVDIVLTGHSHVYDDRTINGVRYITADDFVDNGGTKQVLRLKVSGDTISTETFDLVP